MLIERSTQDAVILLKEKDAYLHALLGEFGNNRFIERLKAEFISLLDNNGFPNSNPLTPYYIEFHLSITISLYRFWHFRGKDLSPDELVGLINRLSTKGLSFQ